MISGDSCGNFSEKWQGARVRKILSDAVAGIRYDVGGGAGFCGIRRPRSRVRYRFGKRIVIVTDVAKSNTSATNIVNIGGHSFPLPRESPVLSRAFSLP